MPKNEIESKLTSADKKALAKHEETIRSGLTSFIEVGHALAEIRDSQLYRDSHKSFEAYCQERWDIGARQAHYKIAAAEVIDNLRSAKSISHMPSFETHAIELSKAGDKATKVWAAVLKASPMAEDGTVCTTVKKIAEVRDAMLKPKADPPPPAQPQAPTDEPSRKDKADGSATQNTQPEAEPPKAVNGIGKHEDVEEPEAPIAREPGEDDDELPGDNLRADEWTGTKLNQVIAAIRYMEDKIVPAEATVVKRIGRLFPHNGLPLKRWNDELASKARDLKIFRNKLQAVKAQQAGAAK
jgi:hypothetical protein